MPEVDSFIDRAILNGQTVVYLIHGNGTGALRKHIYFVAETKGTLDSMKLNHITPVEQAKIDCARAHFKALNDENVVYDVVSDYQTLLNAVMK